VVEVVVCRTEEISGPELTELRGMLNGAFRRFDDDDWQHALGGVHALVREDGAIVSHAAVVPRTLVAGDRQLAVGYVEAVASTEAVRGRGLARRAMEEINAIIRSTYDLGALSTGVWDFYAGLGWLRWQGPTFVDAPEGRVRTPDDDDSTMVLLTDRTADLPVAIDLTCDWRPGDVW
jgi:aminoglycoside 2'-N-acetyltransferase I